MPLKKLHGRTPGTRTATGFDFKEITTKKPGVKRLVKSKRRISGRNNQGVTTVRFRGGGAKRAYRVIDFSGREKLGVPAKIVTIEYDPNRRARIGLLHYVDGDKRYMLVPQKVRVGFTILTAEKAPPSPGNRMALRNVPEGVAIHNLELFPGRGGTIVRTAGSSATLMSLEGQYALVRLPSGEIRKFEKDCFASIGALGNAEAMNVNLGKAGRKRYLGRRPHNRGSSMNPNDHPHGGGEGKAPIGRSGPLTPWGKKALGYKTRRRKDSSKWIVRSRHAAKKK
jgi:large subunit ribosomal protein L2